MKKDDIRKSIAAFYDKVAREDQEVLVSIDELNLSLGYSKEDLKNIPLEAQMGLGCGNPHLKGKPREAEIVADLGSGRGMDVFLASQAVGKEGWVIGIDANPLMIEKAREISRKNNFTNTEFRLGEIEHLPVADNQLDLVLSNCAINLSTNKAQVYREIYRILKPGGRISISDIMLKKELPEEIKSDPNIYGT